MKIHTFGNSNKKGLIGEQVVTKYFESLGYVVSRLSIPDQKRLGYDLKIHKDNKTFGIEVKTEFEADNTGNIFYETKIVTDDTEKTGWCLKYPDTSKVMIFWYLPNTRRLLIYPANKLKQLEYQLFKLRKCFNPNYYAEGHLIPLTYLLPKCKVVELEVADV